MSSRKKPIAGFVAILVLTASWIGTAQALTVTGGKIRNIFADPSDFVVELDSAGSCGSHYFHIQRVNPNFKEMVAISLTAFAAGKSMTFFVASCINGTDRNLVDHGFASS